MDKYFAKVIGLILLVIAISIIADLTRGIPAGGILNLITQFAPLNLNSITWAQIGSFFLALVLVLFGVKVLNNKTNSKISDATSKAVKLKKSHRIGKSQEFLL